MTQRKPPGVSFETWIDRQVREAAERGEFDDLPGTGRPIADIDRPRDEMWWVRQKLRRESLSYLPPALALRKEAEDALAAAARATSESEVHRIVAGLNDKIRQANRRPTAGPPTDLAPFDVESVVRDWRERRRAQDTPPATRREPEVGLPAGGTGRRTRRRGLWRRRR